MVCDPGTVLMEAGRPVLVVPPAVERLDAARIVIAWKDTPRHAAPSRAALPFVARADKVFVAAAGIEARFEGADEVSDLLCRHGAHVTTNLLDAPGARSRTRCLGSPSARMPTLCVWAATAIRGCGSGCSAA